MLVESTPFPGERYYGRRRHCILVDNLIHINIYMTEIGKRLMRDGEALFSLNNNLARGSKKVNERNQTGGVKMLTMAEEWQRATGAC